MAKIMMVTQSEGGGLRRHLVDLINGLLLKGHQVIFVFNSKYGDSEFKKWILSNADNPLLTLVDLPDFSREISPKKDLSTLSDLRKLMVKFSPDVVHAHSSKAGVLARIAAKQVKIDKVFYTPHAYAFLSNEFSNSKRKIYALIETIMSRFFTTRTFAVSQSERSEALKRHIDSENKIVTIPNALPDLPNVDADFERQRLNVADDEFVVLNVARVTSQKNPELFINIAKYVQQMNLNIKFFWVGSVAPEYNRVVAEQKSVEFLGEYRETDRLVFGADLVLSSSRFEGLSYSLLEAARAGKPVVLSNVSGNTDFANDYAKSVLFNLTDSVNSIGDLIIESYQSRNAVSEVEEGGNRYDFEMMISKIIAEYNL